MEILKDRGWPHDHIKHDQKVEKQYEIIMGHSHDGTMIFVQEIIEKALLRLVNMQTHYKPTTPKDWSKVTGINYVIGDIKMATVFGRVAIAGGNFPGQRERLRIPVKCEYVYA